MRPIDDDLRMHTLSFVAFAMLATNVMAVEPATTPTLQWEPVELRFESEQTYPWWEFPVHATFIHEESGTQLKLEAFYDGPRKYTLRFAPSLAGKWNYRTSSVDSAMNERTGMLTVEPPSKEQVTANSNLRGHVRVSSNRRYFQHADGTPFFLLGDTNWSINTARCGLGTNEEGPFFDYLKDRKKKRFTTILMAYMRGFGDTDEPAGQRNEGGYPFVDGNVGQLNASYFQSLDTRTQAMWKRGFVLAAHPTWFGKRNCFFDHQSAKRISAYLAVRYGAYNCLWSLSGEYQYSMKDCGWTDQQLTELGEAVQEHNAYRHPLSIHPSGNPKWAAPHGSQSSRAFHQSSWLDHNWLQTGQKIPMLYNVATRALENYELSPVKPVFLSESYYERHTDPERAYHTRWQVWTAYLNGSAGYGYGAMGVWQFYSPEDARGETGKKVDGYLYWKKALDMEGSAQMQPARELLTSFSWWELRPDRKRLTVNGKPNRWPTAEGIVPPHCASGPDGTIVVYIPRGNSNNEIRLERLPEKKFKAFWFNPRTATRIPITNNTRLAEGTIPKRPDPQIEDWVLVLRSADDSKHNE